MASDQARRFEIRGRVQGVGFRAFVRRQAQLLRLRGWVRNRPDGSVEVLAGGPGPALELLAVRLSSGPPGARVELLEEHAAVPPVEPGFKIR